MRTCHRVAPPSASSLCRVRFVPLPSSQLVRHFRCGFSAARRHYSLLPSPLLRSQLQAARRLRLLLSPPLIEYRPVSVSLRYLATATAHVNSALDGSHHSRQPLDTQPISSSSSSSSSSAPLLPSDPPQPAVAAWLLSISALVFVMVALGGLTRLTKSGLSMVEWKPATGLPPLSDDEWAAEFDKYKQFPEYQLVNNHMALDDFKRIYYMEFAHRQLGRLIGVAFAVPFLYFLVNRQLSRPLLGRLSLLLAAGGMQGAIGWWMVRSGLEQPHTGESGAVHVSPYRLATHLLSAFAIYALLLSTALHLRYPHSSELLALYSSSADVRRLKQLSVAAGCMVALTISSGAFVAGNEAGLVYNEFPLMGGRLIPQDLTSPYIRGWRNLFEHSTLVQFTHRVLAVSTLTAITGLWWLSRRHRVALTRPMQRMSTAVVLMAWTQVALGITTLLLYVPTPLASLHQCGSLVLLSLVIGLVHVMGAKRAKGLTAVGAVIRRRLVGSIDASGSMQPLQPSLVNERLIRGAAAQQ